MAAKLIKSRITQEMGLWVFLWETKLILVTGVGRPTHYRLHSSQDGILCCTNGERSVGSNIHSSLFSDRACDVTSCFPTMMAYIHELHAGINPFSLKLVLSGHFVHSSQTRNHHSSTQCSFIKKKGSFRSYHIVAKTS